MSPGAGGAARRIAIVGCGGAGKSRLARELGRRLGLPVVHLDAHFWRPGWVETPRAEWEALQPSLLAGDSWIADGNYHATLPVRLDRADTVLFLDMPRLACLRGVLARRLRHRGTNREDLPPGCPEKIEWEFLKWIWNFPRDVRPATLAMLREFEARGGRVVVLRSRGEVAGFLSSLEGPGPREAPAGR
jgi:adenylate kinase family enzyme